MDQISSLLAQLGSKIPSYGRQVRPERDWFVLLGIATAIFLLSAAWNGYLFLRVAYGGMLGEGAPTSELTAPDFAELKEVTALFEERAVLSRKYKDGTYRFVDPSR